jgi:hypothetical protein
MQVITSPLPHTGALTPNPSLLALPTLLKTHTYIPISTYTLVHVEHVQLEAQYLVPSVHILSILPIPPLPTSCNTLPLSCIYYIYIII